MISLDHLVEHNVVPKSLDKVIDIGLKDNIIERAIKDGNRHVDVIDGVLRGHLATINRHIGILTVVKSTEVATVGHALTVVDSCTVACARWEAGQHRRCPLHVVDLLKEEI